MKITIKSLALSNFKGAKSRTINFGDSTVIKGKNKTGKSTIADAFAWLLFGKDALDRKDFEVKPLDEHGNEKHKLETEVTGIVDIDGIETNFRRVLKEKWVKARGSDIAEYTGNETLYFINDVPKSQKEYQDYINQIIPEATFKLLTSATYFNSLKWQDKRTMLTAIANIPGDDDVAGSDLKEVLEMMRKERKSVTDFKKEYAAKKTKLKTELDQIPGRLDELDRATPAPEDWDDIEQQIANNKDAITEIDNQIKDASKVVEAEVSERSRMIRVKAEIETAMSNIVFKTRKEFSETSMAKENTIAGIRQNIEFKQVRSKEIQQEIARVEANTTTINEVIASLRKQYEDVNSRTCNTDEVITTCPTCKQSLPESEVEQMRESVIANFNKQKLADWESINSQGKQYKEQIESNKKLIEGYRSQIARIDAEIIDLKQQIATIDKAPSELKTVEALLTENTEYCSLVDRLAKIVIPAPVEQPDTSELQMIKNNLTQVNEDLTKKLAAKSVIEANNKRKQQLFDLESEYASQIADLEKIEFHIAEFTKRKINAVEQSVNKLFPTVRFRMFDQQINGGETETCVCLVGGVPFSDCNTGDKIMAGVEIIEVFSSIHGISAPIWIDNRESVTYDIHSNSQLIHLVADREVETLTVIS